MTADTPICTTCRSAPALTPRLPTCRGCLKAEVERDRANRQAAQRLAWERSRFERRKRQPAGWPEDAA
jgi:hypothetical protein